MIYHSTSLSVFENLAAEEYLLDHLDELGPVLMFWRSDRAVVIGKNQNPLQEINLPAVREGAFCWARRLSGGGTVYHDRGNLNYAFILPRREYREAHVHEMVVSALKTVGVEAFLQNKNSLAVKEGKISGTAFCYRRNAALHHGTLLLRTDLEALHRALRVPALEIDTKAIQSRPAGVANLRDLYSELTDGAVMDALSAAFAAEGYDASPLDTSIWDDELIGCITEKYQSYDWLWGYMPACSIRIGAVTLFLRRGMIYAWCENDGVQRELPEPLPLTAQTCQSSELAGVLDQHHPDMQCLLACLSSD